MGKKYFLLLLIFAFIDANAQEIIHFTDLNLKAALISPDNTNGNNFTYNQNEEQINVDANHDGEIDTAEALLVYQISISNAGITSMDGIEYFTNLTHLLCNYLPVTQINVTALVNLNTLALNELNLSALDVSANINLSTLVVHATQITSLDISQLHKITNFNCRNNNISTLFLGDNPFIFLNVAFNHLQVLDVSRYRDLLLLSAEYNELTSLDLSNQEHMASLYCGANKLSELDVSHSPQMTYLYCSDNPLLEHMNLKRGNYYWNGLSFANLPNLKYICADDNNVQVIQQQIVTDGLTNCHVNSYCSFIPGGEVFTVEGNSRFDGNGTGCGAGSIPYPNLKLSFSNGTATGSLISDASGIYGLSVQEGIHTITPILESNTYFTVSPTVASVAFPVSASPFLQDFCITPNGTHNDLEITLIPLSPARPGFDSDYKMIYSNKGTTVQSGSLSFILNSEIADIVSTNPAATSETGNSISWNFTGLQPFESRSVAIKLNHNSPLDSPPLNDGALLGFYAEIQSTVNDETPENNSFKLFQTMVNSLDPNDKTCLEGNAVGMEIAGKYVHYMIRFENTGTANAENIVVKDLVDSTKFDIGSLIPIGGSHNFVTKISEENKVEFIFENINLPFDDLHNDGYVIFKIRTKPSIFNESEFSNTASIYFDYNPAVVTNTETTYIINLNTKDFVASDRISISPNPVSSELNINSENSINIYRISIYNISGQLMQAIPNAQFIKNINLSNLAAGNYFVKFDTDQGAVTLKMIKS